MMKNWIRSIFGEVEKGVSYEDEECFQNSSTKAQFSPPISTKTLENKEEEKEIFLEGRPPSFDKLRPSPSIPKLKNSSSKYLNLNNLKGESFEYFCLNDLLKKMGFTGKLTVASGDGGIDIMAKIEIPLSSDIKIITLTIPCQCKGYSEENKVGINEIRNFMGALIHEKSHYGFFFTSSYYTDDAQTYVNNLKRLGYFIELFDKDRIWSILDSLDKKNGND